jgi:hypothetical protein
MGIFSKKVTINDVGELLAKFVFGSAPGQNDNEDYSMCIETLSVLGIPKPSKELFIGEFIFLRAFTVTLCLSHLCKRKDIAPKVHDVYNQNILKIMNKLGIPDSYLDAMNNRINNYIEAASGPIEHLGTIVAECFSYFLTESSSSYLSPFGVYCQGLFVSNVSCVNKAIDMEGKVF